MANNRLGHLFVNTFVRHRSMGNLQVGHGPNRNRTILYLLAWSPLGSYLSLPEWQLKGQDIFGLVHVTLRLCPRCRPN